MKIFLKNFFRNNICNLTIASIRHFRPDADIYCLCQYKEKASEYDALEPLNLPLFKIFYRQSKYTNLGPSKANQYNNLFFTEGYNQIFDFVQKEHENKNESMLLLAEDHFFTTGNTLNELDNIDCDVAYGSWDAENSSGANGSILYFLPEVAKYFFPIHEQHTTIEKSLKDSFIRKFNEKRAHRITTRNELNYGGDGKYSNDYEEIKGELIKAGILK